MNLSSFETFLAIAEYGQLNRAAERLHVTQSTVTTRLNALEAELGQTLFLRRKSGTEMTSAGFRFQRYAQLMVDSWRQARRETALPANVESTFNLGCDPDLWPGLGRNLFNWLQDRHPQVAISAWSGDQPELDRWLGSGLVDAALSFAPLIRDSRAGYRLPPDRLVMVSSRLQTQAQPGSDYLYVDSGEDFRKQHAASFPAGDTPTVSLSSASWALDFLLQRGGSGYLPLRLVDSELAAERLFRVPDAPEFERNRYFVVNRAAAENWPFMHSLLDELGYTGV